MQRVAVINQKGGVGKTTTTVNFGAALAASGKRVVLLDMDPQSNLSLHLDQRPEMEASTMTSALVDDVPLEDIVRPTSTPNLFVIPADTTLAGVEQVLANRIGRETLLREAFEKLGPAFDYVLMDCPPSLGVLSANALVAADEVLIPMQTEYFALQGMAKLMEVIQLVQKRLNPTLKVRYILPCMVDMRTNLTTEVLGEIEHHCGDLLAKSRIRTNVKLAEAPSFGRTIFQHAPESNGAEDYRLFAREYLGKAIDEEFGEESEEGADDAAEETTAEPTASRSELTAEEAAAFEEFAEPATTDSTESPNEAAPPATAPNPTSWTPPPRPANPPEAPGSIGEAGA